MRKIILTPLIAILLSFGLSFNLTAQDLMITGIADGPLSGGTPKALELYVINDIPDLSVYGIDIAANGAASSGSPTITLPANSATAGDFIYLSGTEQEFLDFFGFSPDVFTGSVSFNGNDAIELYHSGAVVDVFGVVGVDGSGEAWDYLDGWAYRNNSTTPSATFNDADWSFSGTNQLENGTTNATCDVPMPIGTFTMGGGGTLALPFYETYETWPLDNWTVEGTGTEVWESNDGSTYGPGSVTEGSLAAMFNVYSAPSGNTTTMTTDVIDMDGAINPTLSFDFWMDGWSADPNLWLKVEMTTDGSTWNEIFYHEYDGNSGWNSESMILSGATATTQIRIIGASDYGSYNIFVDKLAVEEVTCPPPTDLALDANTATEATFSWTENGTALAWNLIYGAPGFDPLTEGTTVTAGTNPYTITGLTATTDYHIYVQADCGAGDLSTMNGPVNFTTDCGVYTTPFAEDFTSYVPNCWSEATGLLADPVVILTTSSAWTADGFANVGTTGAAKVNNYGTTRDEWLFTPEIDLGDGSVPMQLEFDLALTAWNSTAAAAAAPDDKFAVIVSTDGGATWTSANTLAIWDNVGSPYVYDNIATAGERIILDLTGYTGNVKFGFYAESTVSNGDNDLFIDNVDVLETPDCSTPTGLALDANTATEATFSWTENGTAMAWNLIYGTPGFDPLTEGTAVNANTIPFTVSGLTAATTYEIYVQADCGSGSTSTFSSPISFTTDCDVIVAPYTQDFENSGDAPICWTNEGVGEQWEFGTTAAYGPSEDHTSGTGYFAWVDDSAPHSTDVVLTSPVIDITSLTNPTLYFWLYSDNNGASNMTLNVDVWDGTTWNNAVASYAANTTGWTEMLVDLSAYAGSGNVQVRFHADETSSGTDYQNDIAIDDVSFDEAPSCYTPSNIAVDAFTATTATLSWTENGSATDWNIVYGTPGFDPLTEGTTVTAGTNPFTVDPLTADTEYEFYVQADCGGGDLSALNGPVMFTTLCETLTTLPWTETFEETSLTRDCWSQIQETGTKEWTFDEGSSGGSITTAYEGTLNAVFTSSSGGPYITKLVSPVLDLSSGSGYAVDFYYGQESWFSDQNSLKVYYRENETASWTEIGDYPTEVADWTFSSIVLPNVSATYQIAFEGIDEYGRANVIDNVTVREISTETDFLTYSFAEQTGAADIDYTAYTIDVEVGNGTDLTTLVADYTLSTGATADIAGTPQESGVTANDFSSPVTYTVTAEDGTTSQAWVVTVTEAPINTEADILTYSFPEETGAATIDATEKTVDIEVAWNADVTALVADFTLSYGATTAIAGTNQESGVTANDFTNPVVYTVTAEDGITTDDWTVTVTLGDVPMGANCDNPFMVNLPSELPYTHADQTNCGLENEYSDTELNLYDNGEDAIYEITVTSDVFVNITLDPGTSTYTGIGVFDGCPSTDNMITSNTNSAASPHGMEGVALTAGTYYIMIDTWPSPNCIDNYTLTITTDPIADYANNTTLILTPETQNVATGDNANGVLDVVYPATVSDAMPVDMMTDAMIDLSELTAGAVVELLDAGTSLGTYTVTGGETVWASDAFTGINRVPADMTEGQSLSWDVVISGLADGTYNVSATLYLGLDADLTAETNMTEAATDAMEIIVAAPFIDLALLMPDGNAFVCDFTDPQNAPVEILNVGNTTIASGETINFVLDANGSNEITEDIILSEDLLPGETYETMTTNTVDFSALGLYEWEATIVYTGDVDMMNNFTTGYTVHFNQEIEFIGAVNDTITIASTDWPYTIETDLTLTTDSVLVSTYEWELDGSTETNLTVNADGWYTLHVTTEYCTTTDSVYVLAFNNIEGVTADEFSVYPNPNNGQFMIEMNLVEKQDVMLSIFNSNGQLVREFKFDDIDSFARQIDMNNVAEGLYLIRINAGGNMFNSQVVIR